MVRATLKGLLAHKLRLALTALSIVLGVAFVAGTLIFTDTIGRAFDSLFADAFAGIDATIRSEADEDLTFVQPGRFDEAVLDDVLAVDGVKDATPNVFGYAQFVAVDPVTGEVGPISAGGPSFGFSWPDSEDQTNVIIVQGVAPVAPDEVAMDISTAERLELGVDDEVQILFSDSTDTFTIVGISGFGSEGQPGGFTSASFELRTAQDRLGAVGQLDSIDVVADDGVSAEELVDRLSAIVPADLEVVTAQTAAEEQASQIKDALGFFNIFLLVFAGIALFVGTFIIQNTFRIIVAQRTRELGLLRALGASARQVTAMVMTEAVIVGLLGSALGILLGLGLAAGLRALLEAIGIAFPAAPVQLQPSTVIAGLIVGVGVTTVSALIPARQAARVPPIAALQTVDVAFERGSLRRRLLAGSVITGVGVMAGVVGLFAPLEDSPVPPISVVGIGVALLFIGVTVLSPAFAGQMAWVIGTPVAAVSLPGKLARGNAARSPRRTSATAAALMVGLALVGLVAVFSESLKATVGEVLADSFLADFAVQPATSGFGGPGLGLSTAVADGLAELPQVDEVSRMRFNQAKVGESITFLGGGEPNLDRMFDLGLIEGSLERLVGESVAVSEAQATEKGIALGNSVEFEFAATGMETFEVVAIYSEEIAGAYLISLEAYEENFIEQLDATVYVRLGPGVSSETGREAIESVTASYPGTDVLDATGIQEQAEAQVDQLLNVFIALLALAVLISVLGITNTLSLSVIERTREIGLLRAIGMSRRQVRTTVRWEAVIIAVFGALMGVTLGLVLAWAVIQALQDQGLRFAVPVGQMVILVAVAGIAGVIAALPPAYRAARLNILEAIAYE